MITMMATRLVQQSQPMPLHQQLAGTAAPAPRLQQSARAISAAQAKLANWATQTAM